MAEAEFSAHIQDMLAERDLQEEWIWRALREPDQHWNGQTAMSILRKQSRNNRILHVVVNANAQPKRVVTVFFDRRLRS